MERRRSRRSGTPPYYVYFRSKGGAYLFDRTCGTERRAAERVGELVKEYKHDQAIYVKNHLIAGAFY